MRRKAIPNIDSKILELLCKDFTQREIAEMLEVCISSIEKRITLLKCEYNVKTLTGLIHQYTLKNLKNQKNHVTIS